jgi:hypothetical protein
MEAWPEAIPAFLIPQKKVRMALFVVSDGVGILTVALYGGTLIKLSLVLDSSGADEAHVYCSHAWSCSFR